MRREFGEIWRDNWQPLALAGLITLLAGVFNWRNNLSIAGASIWLTSLGLWLFVLAPTFLFPRRVRMALLALLALAAALVLFSNQIYFRYYRDFITSTTLVFAGQVYGVRNSILPLAKITDLVYFLPLSIPLLYLLRSAPRGAWTFFPSLSKAVVTASLGVGLFSYGYLPLAEQWRNNDVNWDGNFPYVQKLGMFSYYVFEGQRYLAHKSSDVVVDEVALERIQGHFNALSRRPNALTGVGGGMNLLAVQLESFESFPIGLSIKGQEVTPNLNRLAQDSLYFPNIFYQTARGNTSDAEFLFNNSLLPWRHASVNWLFPGNDYFSLPRLLKQRGYSTVAFHAFDKIYWNREFMYPRMGFEAFYSQDSYKKDEIINLGLSDESFYRQSMAILARKSEPFYAQMVSLTSHHPYKMPQSHQVLDLPGDLPDYVKGYLHSVHYADKAVGTLLRELESKGLKERTILAIYGDHAGISESHHRDVLRLQGRDSGEQGEFAKMALQTVPLIIHVPGSGQRDTLEHVGGQVDILPTLSNILGIEGEGLFMGQDLLETPRKPVLLTARFPLGSFADDEAIFVAAPDGRLESGAYYDRKQGRPLAPELASEKVKQVLEMYDVSQQVIRHNLLPRLRGEGADDSLVLVP